MNLKRKQVTKVKSYFDDDDDENEFNVLPTSYVAAALQGRGQSFSGDLNKPLSDSMAVADPLDIFMMGVEEQIKKDEENRLSQRASSSLSSIQAPEIVSRSDLVDNEESDEEYDHIHNQYNDEDGIDETKQEYEYDSDGKLAPKNKNAQKIEPLPITDHTKIEYPSFQKSLYQIQKDIEILTPAEISKVRSNLEIVVHGQDVPAPVTLFEQMSFPDKLIKEIKNLKFEKPTPIQCQSVPIILSGRDLIGLAQTGSGKSFAFIWPMIIHVINQPQMLSGDGPIGIILAPTRELVQQIYTEILKFSKLYNIRAVAVYGGPGKYEMAKSLKEDAPEIVVATPGRFIELIKMKATNLQRCTQVVLDEADQMFDFGFQYQMRSIVNNIRPDRQTLLFSATMKKKVEDFARQILSNPVHIVVGRIGQANPDIFQKVELLPNSTEKYQWLLQNLDDYIANGKILLFVSNKQETEMLTLALNKFFQIERHLDIEIGSLHGDKDQTERSAIIKKFSRAESNMSVLVATDIASRGLDIKDVRTVINYDIPKNIETYVHRIGRTSRMNVDGVQPGTAYTLLLPQDGSFAVDLVHNLKLSSQQVPSALLKLAEKDPKWTRSKYSGAGSGGGRGGAGGGLGFGNTSRAMSSADAAQNTKGSTNNVVNSSNAAVMNKYLNTTATATAATSTATVVTSDSKPHTMISSNDTNQRRIETVTTTATATAAPATGKRKSRFSDAAPVVAAPVLAGFVRASTGSCGDGTSSMQSKTSSVSSVTVTATTTNTISTTTITTTTTTTTTTGLPNNSTLSLHPRPAFDALVRTLPVLAGYVRANLSQQDQLLSKSASATSTVEASPRNGDVTVDIIDTVTTAAFAGTTSTVKESEAKCTPSGNLISADDPGDRFASLTAVAALQLEQQSSALALDSITTAVTATATTTIAATTTTATAGNNASAAAAKIANCKFADLPVLAGFLKANTTDLSSSSYRDILTTTTTTTATAAAAAAVTVADNVAPAAGTTAGSVVDDRSKISLPQNHAKKKSRWDS